MLQCDDRIPDYGSRYHSMIDGETQLVIRGPRRPWGLIMTQREIRIWAAASSPSSSVDPKNEQASGWGICVYNDLLMDFSRRGTKEIADRNMEKALGNLASEKWFSSRTWDLKCGLQAFPHHTAMAYHTVSIDH